MPQFTPIFLEKRSTSIIFFALHKNEGVLGGL